MAAGAPWSERVARDSHLVVVSESSLRTPYHPIPGSLLPEPSASKAGVGRPNLQSRTTSMAENKTAADISSGALTASVALLSRRSHAHGPETVPDSVQCSLNFSRHPVRYPMPP